MLLAPRLDILALGDDAASVLGVHVRRTRVAVTLVAVLLAAAAVTVAGPIAFVGLVAPVLVRLLAPLVPGCCGTGSCCRRRRWPACWSCSASDVVLRAVLGGQAGVDVPTGIATMLFGAVVLVWLARGYRDSGPSRRCRPTGPACGARRTSWPVVGALSVAAGGCAGARRCWPATPGCSSATC